MGLQDFDLEGRTEDIEAITRDNTFMAELQSRIVPLIVQHDVFWTRYFYQYASAYAYAPQTPSLSCMFEYHRISSAENILKSRAPTISPFSLKDNIPDRGQWLICICNAQTCI